MGCKAHFLQAYFFVSGHFLDLHFLEWTNFCCKTVASLSSNRIYCGLVFVDRLSRVDPSSNRGAALRALLGP